MCLARADEEEKKLLATCIAGFGPTLQRNTSWPARLLLHWPTELEERQGNEK
jgi:hypothetical protein